MKLIIATVLILMVPVLVLAGNSDGSFENTPGQDSKSAPAVPLISPAICGKSNLVLKLGEQSVGNETFDIRCLPGGGYSATGHTVLKVPGSSMDLTTIIDLDKFGSPISSTAKGTVGGRPLEQSVVIKDGTGTVTTNGNS